MLGGGGLDEEGTQDRIVLFYAIITHPSAALVFYFYITV